MDKYLNPEESYQRLLSEYRKYNGSLIVGVDFDDTLYDFHGQGNTCELVKQLIRDLFKVGCYIIVWTGNKDTDLVTSYLKEENVPYHSINEDHPISVKLMGTPRKLYCNVYIDDRAGLHQVYNDLKRLLNEITTH